MAATNDVGDSHYIFSTGDAAMARLRLLDAVYGPSTEMLLRDVGIGPGMRVADVGCGIGSVSCESARLVGSGGEVVGIDVSPAQLKIAASAAQAAGLGNIEFVEASATEIPFEAADFDVIFCRLVLTHMPDPESAIREFHRVLRPGGKLACEELNGPQAFSSPATPVYTRLSDIVAAFGQGRGVDYSIGLRLPHLIKNAGFESPKVRFVQPAYFSGEEKRWWEHTNREAAPAIVKSGFMSEDEIQSILDDLEAVSADGDILIAQAPVAQVWAERG